MKSLKPIGWGIAGLLVGQAIGLFSSKPALKKKLSDAQGADKVKVVFDELVSFNTQMIQSVDWDQIQSSITNRVESLQADITKLGDEWSTLTKEKASQMVDKLSTSSDQIKADVAEYVTDLDQKHQLTDKLSTLGAHIIALKNKINELAA